MDSILDSVKKALGIVPENTDFDDVLIIYINGILSTILPQLGVGPENGYTIEDKGDEWADYISDLTNLESVKTYIALKVRLIFDPPTSSAVLESIKAMIAELEWRLNVTVDPGKVGEEDGT